MVAGEHFAGATKAGGDFVGNEQYVVFVAQLAQLLQIQRRINTHAGTALHNGLHNHSCGFLSMLSKGFFCVFEAFTLTVLAVLVEGAAIAIGSLYMNIIHHHGLIHLSK